MKGPERKAQVEAAATWARLGAGDSLEAITRPRRCGSMTTACATCREPGHNSRTCGRPGPRRRRSITATPFDAEAVDAEAAIALVALDVEPVLLRLRKIIPFARREKRENFLDSLMLSCYLQGALEAERQPIAAVNPSTEGGSGP